jgi:AraC family transcriptional regulator, transcriptional activator FtrA
MHRVVSVVASKVTMFELAVPCEVFGIDRPEIPDWDYSHEVCALEPGPISAGNGITVTPTAGLEALEHADTIVVPAWNEPRRAVPAVLTDALIAAHERGARLISVCTGAFVLCATGLLDGKRATTHWMHAAEMARAYPAVEVDPSVLYVREGSIFTSAGTAAGIDLCLHLVRLDLGAEAANRVARRMVVPPHRDGGQAQYVVAPVPECTDDPLGELLAWMLDHLDEPLTVAQLAERAATSPRTLARRFTAATGTTPLQWLLCQRVLRAQQLLEGTDLPVEQVAHRCGFSSAAGLRLHFQRTVGASPQAYRSTFRASAVAV